MGEAPSSNTSTRSTAADGMAPRSTESSAPFPPCTKRRPFSSTSVRREPRPRRDMRTEPSPPLFQLELAPLACMGCAWRKSPRVTFPLAWSCSLVKISTGAGEVRSLRRRREPVTTTSSIWTTSGVRYISARKVTPSRTASAVLVSGWYPSSSALSRYWPAGSSPRVKAPSAPATAVHPESASTSSAATTAPGRGLPVAASTTRPVIDPAPSSAVAGSSAQSTAPSARSHRRGDGSMAPLTCVAETTAHARAQEQTHPGLVR